MSDAPQNPDRVWDAGLRNEDVVALIACSDGPDGPVPANQAVYFTADALRKSVAHSTLGPPKSASEGAERDRTWPATVPSRPGKVLSVEPNRLVVIMEGDGGGPRRQTFTLNGKHPYVRPGEQLQAGITILAGATESRADLGCHLRDSYTPLNQLRSASPLDRYAGVKSLRSRADYSGVLK